MSPNDDGSDKPETIGSVALTVAIMIGMIPINAYVTAWTLSRAWSWLIETQYGPGPKMGTWFGLSLIAGIVIRDKMPSRRDEMRSRDLIVRVLAGPVLMVLALWIARIVAQLMGWMG